MNVDKIVDNYFREKKINTIVALITSILYFFIIKCFGILHVILYFFLFHGILSYETNKALTGILDKDCNAEEYWKVFSALYGKSKRRKQRYYIHIIRGLYAMGKLEDMEQAMDGYEGKVQLSSKNKINIYLYRIYLNAEMHPQENPKLIQEFQEFLSSIKARKYLKKRGKDALDTWFLIERVKQNPSQKDLELLESKMRRKKSNYNRFSLMDYLGRGYLKLGNREKAKNYLSQVAGIDSDLPFIQEARAFYQEEFGETVKLFSLKNERRRNREQFILRKKILIMVSCCFLCLIISLHCLDVFLPYDRKETAEDREKIRVEQRAERIDGKIYYDSIEDAVKYGSEEWLDDEESYMRTIDKVILERKRGKYITLFYTAREDGDSDFCLVMMQLETREKKGNKRYRVISFRPDGLITEPSWAVGELSKDAIRDSISMNFFIQKMTFNQDLYRDLWDVCDSKKIYQLRINGKAPDSIVPIDKGEKVFYLWYYDDVEDIPDASKAKIEFVEPDGTNP